MSHPWDAGISVVRFLARGGSLASALVVVAFLIGGEEPGSWPTANELIGLACFPLGVLFGLLLGWKSELWGGLVAIGALAAFYAWHLSVANKFPAGPYFLILASPAFLFLIVGLLRRPKAPYRPKAP